MSTKIYEAYIIPQDKIKELSDTIFLQFREQTIDRVKHIIDSIKLDEFIDTLDSDTIEQNNLIYRFWDYLLNKIFLPASRSMEKSFFNLDYGFWVYPYKRYFLIIPKVPQWMFYDLLSSKLDDLDYVDNFSYWNNTDMPENVTDEEWGHREEVWEHVFRNSVCFYLSGFETSSEFTGLMFDVQELYLGD